MWDIFSNISQTMNAVKELAIFWIVLKTRNSLQRYICITSLYTHLRLCTTFSFAWTTYVQLGIRILSPPLFFSSSRIFLDSVIGISYDYNVTLVYMFVICSILDRDALTRYEAGWFSLHTPKRNSISNLRLIKLVTYWSRDLLFTLLLVVELDLQEIKKFRHEILIKPRNKQKDL